MFAISDTAAGVSVAGIELWCLAGLDVFTDTAIWIWTLGAGPISSRPWRRYGGPV